MTAACRHPNTAEGPVSPPSYTGFVDATVARLLPEGLDEEAVEALPGAELVLPGLADLAAERTTIEAYLASVAALNLIDIGFTVPTALPQPEDAVYRILHAEDEDSAHGRYNALIRRVVSFERAAASEVRWRRAARR